MCYDYSCCILKHFKHPLDIHYSLRKHFAFPQTADEGLLSQTFYTTTASRTGRGFHGQKGCSFMFSTTRNPSWCRALSFLQHDELLPLPPPPTCLTSTHGGEKTRGWLGTNFFCRHHNIKCNYNQIKINDVSSLKRSEWESFPEP